LTTLFSDSAITTVAPIDARPPRKKLGWLPLLTVLFCLSYGLMTMLIVEQGATIESQRALIRELFRDSTELSATKMKAQQQKILAGAQAGKAQSQTPSTQIPSTQTPSAQANQAPSSQAVPQQQHTKQNPADKAKTQFQMPSRPASDLQDVRRELKTI
jgi:predicted lipid-binding transport protein (Tim44 family)